jgi:hypothetical protein
LWNMGLRKIYPIKSSGQMKIQQMAFMVLAVFFFFVLVGIFFVGFSFKNIEKSADQLQIEQAISSLKVISDMTELNCGGGEDLCLDEDKLKIMSGNFSAGYRNFWPVASVKVYRISPAFSEAIKCPALGCNYFDIYDNGQKNVREYSTYVSICKKIKEEGYVYDKCEIGKLLVGAIDYAE